MSKRVTYTGTSDVQIFGAEDFKKADVEGRKTTFKQGQPVEVDDAVADALLSKEGVFGDYSFELADEEADPKGEADDDDEDGTDGTAVTTDTGAGARSTGRGRSTRGAGS